MSVHNSLPTQMVLKYGTEAQKAEFLGPMARGEKIEVVLQQTNATQPGTLTGSVVGVEAKRIPVGKDGIVEEKFDDVVVVETESTGQ